jgi:hypothetical protein
MQIDQPSGHEPVVLDHWIGFDIDQGSDLQHLSELTNLEQGPH